MGIDSENIAMLMASKVRRPNLSASHGQKRPDLLRGHTGINGKLRG